MDVKNCELQNFAGNQQVDRQVDRLFNLYRESKTILNKAFNYTQLFPLIHFISALELETSVEKNPYITQHYIIYNIRVYV